MRTYSYFYQFVPGFTQFIFTVYVRNEERFKVLQNKANMNAYSDFISIKSRFQSITYHSQNCEIRYVNLDLDKQLFGNQSLVLSGNIHSKK
jgi:hypothetical protein